MNNVSIRFISNAITTSLTYHLDGELNDILSNTVHSGTIRLDYMYKKNYRVKRNIRNLALSVNGTVFVKPNASVLTLVVDKAFGVWLRKQYYAYPSPLRLKNKALTLLQVAEEWKRWNYTLS